MKIQANTPKTIIGDYRKGDHTKDLLRYYKKSLKENDETRKKFIRLASGDFENYSNIRISYNSTD